MATQEHSTSTSSGATGNVPTLGSIEDALSLILSVDTDLEAIESTLVPALSRCTDTLLASSIHDDQDPLSLLKPQSHSAGIVFILSARLASPATQESALATAPSIVQALEVDQARLAAQRVVYLARTLQDVGRRLEQPTHTLSILSPLFDKLTVASPQSLTALHPILAYEWLKTGDLDSAFAQPLLHELIDVDAKSFTPRYSDVLEYFYYAGLIYTKAKRLLEAIDAFETCISTPSVAMSAIQLDAYKKLVLVQLLCHGKVSPPPRYTPGALLRSLKSHASAYLLFAASYESREANCVSRLEAVVNEHAATWTRDCNFGLVYQCLSLHRQRRIQRLADVYSTLTLSDIAGAVHAASAEDVLSDVQELVRKRWVHATLDGDTVRFTRPADADADADAFQDVESIRRLQTAIDAAARWNATLAQRERALSRSTEFLRKAQSTRDPRLMGFTQPEDYEDDLLAA